MSRKRPGKVNEIRLVFPGKSENEGLARAAVSGFLAPMDPTLEELSDIKTAVSEAVTNAIVHGYRDTIGQVQLTATRFEGGLVVLKIKDRGRGIEDVEQARQPLFTTAPQEERAGLGFAIMETFMERVRVRSTPGKGTTVLLARTVRGKGQ